MSERPNVKIIAFVGLTGSGKSEAVHYLTGKGYPKIYFGGIIYQAMQDAGIEITFDSQRIFREEIRQKEGTDFVAKHVTRQAHELIAAGQHRIVFDGLYTWPEYKLLKHEFPGEMTVVAITTPKHLRHRRLAVRPARPMTATESQTRDWAEIENLEKGGPIAMADYFILNHKDLDHLHEQIDQIVMEIDF